MSDLKKRWNSLAAKWDRQLTIVLLLMALFVFVGFVRIFYHDDSKSFIGPIGGLFSGGCLIASLLNRLLRRIEALEKRLPSDE
jgi:hypothetical protein